MVLSGLFDGPRIEDLDDVAVETQRRLRETEAEAADDLRDLPWSDDDDDDDDDDGGNPEPPFCGS